MVVHKEAASDIYVLVQQMPEAISGVEFFGGMVVDIYVQSKHVCILYTDICNNIVHKRAPQPLALRGQGSVEFVQLEYTGFHFRIGSKCGRLSINLANDKLVPLLVHLRTKRVGIVETIQHVGNLVGTYDRCVGLRPDLHGEIADKRDVRSICPEDVQLS